MKTVNFAMFIHSHQPVGNFDKVFQTACDRCYQPFLETLAAYPEIRLTLHFSGSLLEWIEDHRPEISDRIAELVRTGQVELMGSGYYEPILSMLTEQDRQGQIRTFTRHLQQRYGAAVRGAWMTERVWEQCLASSLADAGIEYTALDDSHFHAAGLAESALVGSFITEDQGRTVRLFPGSERLRYLIPFHDVDETIQHLGSRADEGGKHVITYADDAEKFGIWPETFEHVYEDGWLRRWFDALRNNSNWIHFITGSEAIDRFPPVGKVYLPDASYREMMEWALPAITLTEMEDLIEELKELGLDQRVHRFMRGGSWRYFRVKYPELALMYAKMMRTSGKVNAMSGRGKTAALTDLYRGQCNCAWWHGVFGGLYLPHLRQGVKRPLIRAEAAADLALVKSNPKQYPWPLVETGDFDFDGHENIAFANPDLRIALKPSVGGHLIEASSTACEMDFIDTLARRKEAYHRKVFKAAEEPATGAVKTIHEISTLKEAGLEKLLQYDWYPRRALIEHFLGPSADVHALAHCQYHEVGDFTVEPYTIAAPPARDARRHTASVTLSRSGGVYMPGGPTSVAINKTITFPASGSHFDIAYAINSSGPIAEGVRFALEINIATVSGGGWGSYYTARKNDEVLVPSGDILQPAAIPGATAIDLVDEAGHFEIHLGCAQDEASSSPPAQPAEVWIFPVQTVSQSESGFERVLQSVAALFIWPIGLGGRQGPWNTALRWEVRHR